MKRLNREEIEKINQENQARFTEKEKKLGVEPILPNTDDGQKLTIKMLRDTGCTLLAEHAEATIDELRKAGAPEHMPSEDKVIRSILKKAAKSQGERLQ